VREEPGHGLCGDVPPDAEKARPCLTLLAQLLDEFVGNVPKPQLVVYYGPSLIAGGTHFSKPPSGEVCSRYAP
jgi:hypothetical protein